ncbi:hypothetical protein AC579_9134 [Pseudocercospora musae]|uniref:Uncharacterized protein n=1 Tax=Pseudocercospora musae TaxID=113226 RepID=A0A139IIH8_9PEZI|nr:hypothetical protein AC579_9134 [Pseudocercospora musae]
MDLEMRAKLAALSAGCAASMNNSGSGSGRGKGKKMDPEIMYRLNFRRGDIQQASAMLGLSRVSLLLSLANMKKEIPVHYPPPATPFPEPE